MPRFSNQILTVFKAGPSQQFVGAAAAALAVAGLRGLGAQGFLVLPHQKRLADAHVQVIPWRHLVQADFPVIVKVRVNAAGGKGGQPAVVVKVFLPGVKESAIAVGGLDNAAQAPVALGKHALQHAGGAVVVVTLILRSVRS